MKKYLILGALALLVACGQHQTPTPNGPQVSAQGEGIYLVHCSFGPPERPHLSTYSVEYGAYPEVKSAAAGYCDPTPETVYHKAEVILERKTPLGFFLPFYSGTPVIKNLFGTRQEWRRQELFAAGPCVPGTYRARLDMNIDVPWQIDWPIDQSKYSAEVEVTCKPKRVSMVIDDTGSMSGEINAVSGALSGYINAQPPEEYTLWNLTTFKDSPSSYGTTTDRAQALGWVGGLYADGGDDCPEDALGGISSGLAALNSGSGADQAEKTMIVATDASAQNGDVNGIIATAQASGVKVNVLLTGDCGLAAARTGLSAASLSTSTLSAQWLSSQVVLKRIAEETGGRYYYMPGGSQQDFRRALDEIFAQIANPTVTDTVPPVVTVTATPDRLWPPNHQMVEVTPTVTVKDNLDPQPRVELLGVTVTEPDDGQGDGHTSDDILIDGSRLFLRAERSGSGGGRTYTVTYRATDASGNTGYGSVDIYVPKNGN